MHDDAAIRPLPAGTSPVLSDDELLDAYPMPPGQPWLRVNFVSSVDGSVTLDGRSGPLGDAADRRMLGLLRVACDALLVGAGTVRVEGYGPLALPERLRRLRRAQGRADDPVLVLVTRRLALDPGHPLFAEAPHRPIVVTTEETARGARERFAPVADVLGLGDDEVDLAAAVAELVKRGLPHILSEGGPHLFGSLLAADLVDELCLTLAPKIVGPGAGRIVDGPASPVRQLALAKVLTAGDELLLRYTRTSE